MASKLFIIEQLNSVCKQMNILNKTFIINGRGLIPLIKLIGSDQDIKEFLIDEEILLKNNGFDILFENNYNEDHEIENGLYFFTDCEITSVNTIDITGYHEAGIDYILNNIDLKGISKDDIDSLDIYSVELFVNNTLLTHYSHSENDTFSKEDLNWYDGSKHDIPIKEKTQKEDNIKESDKSDSEEEIKENTEPKDNVEDDNAKENDKKVKEQKQEVKETENKEEQKKPEKKEKPQKEKKNNNPAPKPEVEEDYDDGFDNNVSEELTEKEIGQNKILLDGIRNEYQKMIDFIDNQRLSQWTPIKRKLENALKNNRFRDQLCVLYLDISDDVSTELYAKLYELDELTADFNKDFIHQIKNFRCYSCGQEWEEEITFLEKGPHLIPCPNCGAERGFEK